LVLKGAYKALEVTKRLIIEVWPNNRKEIFSILRQYGFSIYAIAPSPYLGTINVMAEK